jgi:hypothetical protein
MSHIKITASGEKEEFYGNFILSWYSIGFFGPIVAFIWLSINAYGDPRFGWNGVAAYSSILLFPLFFSFQLCYFSLSDDSLEIRNHIFPWFRKEYPLKDIESLTFCRSGYRVPRSVRIKGAAFRRRIYFAGTLDLVDWYDFGKALKKKGIMVDDNLWRN